MDDTGLVVRHGPFAGLRYPRRARGRAGFLGAKILGSYERELHDVVETALGRRPAQIVDVGSGDGYYLIGLARRVGAGVSVVGFEMDPGERRTCREMARLNDVSVTINAECRPASLRAALEERALLIVDCEGYERELIDPGQIPALARCELIVELHPHVAPNVESLLLGRLAGTHECRIIELGQREPGDYAELAGWPAEQAYLVVSEGWYDEAGRRASGRAWLHARPR